MSERIAWLDLSQIEVRDQKHRLELDIPALAESLRTTGQINPIIVKKAGEKFRVIAGRRRFSALKHLSAEKPIKAKVMIVDLDELQEELITIDENIQREQLSDIEFDEAIYRRKQIYEELHPETKQHTAGAVAANKKGKGAPAFSKDAAKKLKVSRRTIEKSISRAARASEGLKKARAQGLLQSKVDMLVTLEMKEQDVLLPHVRALDLSEVKALVEKTKRHGAKAAVMYLEEERREDPRLKPLLRDAQRFRELLDEAIREDRVLRGDGRHQHFKMLEELQKRLEKFIGIQKAEMGHVSAILRREGTRRVIHTSRPN